MNFKGISVTVNLKIQRVVGLFLPRQELHDPMIHVLCLHVEGILMDDSLWLWKKPGQADMSPFSPPDYLDL